MGTANAKWIIIAERSLLKRLAIITGCKGQSVVEFTLGIIIFLVVAWIPADFGLAFYSGQIAQNAAREGARIAAAETALTTGTRSCTMPGCMSAGNILKETGDRLPAALLPGATVTVLYPTPASAGTCNQLIKVTVSGAYRFFFYQLLRLLNQDTPDSTTIERFTEMRWEHQPGC